MGLYAPEPEAPIPTVVAVQFGPSGVPSFTYHLIALALNPAAITSISPSLSISAASTAYAPSKEASINTSVHPAPSGEPSLINQDTLSSIFAAEIISKSPSPSISS
jgi:hypothetical protein